MGSGHCGSTLLDLILGSHSDAFSLGEIHRIGNSIDAQGDEARICGVCPGHCEFWNDRASMPWLRAFYSHQNIARSLVRRAGHYAFNPYRHLMKWSGKSILIDSSKAAGWIKAQLSPRYRWTGIEPLLIYLHRDGRAVANAYLRKYPERGFDQITRSWARGAQHMEQYFSTFPEAKRMRVSYEALASHPAATVSAICAHFGIEFEPEMLRYWAHDHHHVFGNGGTRNLIYRYREQFSPVTAELEQRIQSAKQHYPHEYYDQVDIAIRLDERWRNELTPDQLESFDTIAGSVNDAYAYDETA